MRLMLVLVGRGNSYVVMVLGGVWEGLENLMVWWLAAWCFTAALDRV